MKKKLSVGIQGSEGFVKHILLRFQGVTLQTQRLTFETSEVKEKILFGVREMLDSLEEDGWEIDSRELISTSYDVEREAKEKEEVEFKASVIEALRVLSNTKSEIQALKKEWGVE